MNVIPAILYMAKRKIYGKNKKGNYWYRARSIINNTKYYVAIKSKDAYDRYILLTLLPDNDKDIIKAGSIKAGSIKAGSIKASVIKKACMHTDLGNVIDMNACIKAYMYKYDLMNKKYDLMNKKYDLMNKKYDPPIAFDFAFGSYLSERPISSNKNIISIDPPGCRDVDDAFSWKYKNDQLFVSVFIADVLFYLNIYSNSDLIKSIAKKVCTIYADNIIISMLPEELVKICSLIGSNKRAVKFKFIINNSEMRLIKVKRIVIDITANLRYTDHWPGLNLLMKELNVKNDHDLIEKLMIGVNSQIAAFCENKYNSKKITIFKEHKNIESRSEYIINSVNSAEVFHEGLQLRGYTSITSPIRRWPDIIAMNQLFDSIININSIIDINEINAKILACKRFYSDLNIIKIIKLLDESGDNCLRDIYVEPKNGGTKIILNFYDHKIEIFNHDYIYGFTQALKTDIYLLKSSNIYERLKFIISIL